MCLLLSLLLALALSVTALADEVTVSTTVPRTHQVTVAVQGDGQILPQDLEASDRLDVERQREQVYRIVPARGQRLAKLLYNGEDVTDQVQNNTFTAPPLRGDASLEAFFEKDPHYHWYDDSDDDDDERSSERDKNKGGTASTSKNDRGGKGGSSGPGKGISPETSDQNRPELWLALLLLSGSGLLGSALWEQRKRRSAEL